VEEAHKPSSKFLWEIIALFSVIAGLMAFFYIIAPPTPLNVTMTFVGVDNTTFIYVIAVSPQISPYWHMHSALTIYSVSTYTGDIAVNCIVKPQPPINITKNEGMLYITLLCPTAITNTTITTNNGIITITPPSPN
jgi:hypothetical protein